MEEIENKKEESKPEDTGKGVQSETVSELDRADQIAERQKRENDRREEILLREENLEARRKVGGNLAAGQSGEGKKEETPKEYANRVMKNE